MKNILIISQFFAPQNSIAAIRFTKVVKYLAKTGNYYFYVICLNANINDLKDEILLKDIQGVKEYVTIMPVNMKKSNEKKNMGVSNDNQSPGVTLVNKKSIYKNVKAGLLGYHENRFWNRICTIIGNSLLLPYEIHDIIEELTFSNRAEKLLERIENKKIDVIISTYGHIGAHLTGLRCKKKWPHCSWIVDYRDPVRSNAWVSNIFVNRISQKADQLATYITGAAKSYCGSGICSYKFHVIYNSFDKEDIRDIEKVKSNSKLTICYAGRIYKEKQSMIPLFKAINELEREKKLDKRYIEILYIGNQFEDLKTEAAVFGAEKMIINGGFVPRKKALQIQMSSDILCVMTWNQRSDGDIIPGKFFEYFMMNKPILALVSGDKSNSTIKNIVNESRVGFCYEEAEAESDYKLFKQWVYDKYVEYFDKGELSNKVDRDYIEQYTSKKMAKKFEKLIIKCDMQNNRLYGNDARRGHD